MKKQNLCQAVLLLAISVGIHALDERINLGGEDLWSNLSEIRGTKLIPGREGFPDVVLADSEYEVTETTDLLLHFNTYPPREETSRYRIRPSNLRTVAPHARFGEGAGIFSADEGGLELTPLPGSLLSPGIVNSDFSIEFWLFPAVLQDGETVLLWTGNRLRNDVLLRQEIRCTATDRGLVWSFLNFFTPATGEEFLVTLTPVSRLIPRTWHHHLLRFDSDTGMIEYLVDDRTEAVGFSSATGNEHSTLHLPRIGESSRGNLIIAPSFTGFIDEFRISRRFITEPVLRKFQKAAGSCVTKVIDLKYSNSLITGFEAVTDTPSSTAVFFYYRCSDMKNGTESVPGEWMPFQPEKPLTTILRGRFLQLKFDLFTDGYEGQSPHISRISVLYESDRPPQPPARLTAEPHDGAVILRWSAVPESDVAGYKVFYGERSGMYFGKDAREGISPIDVGETTTFTLSGLENGKLYFFSVTAYDDAPQPHTGDFSRETNARPSRVYQ